MVLSCLIFVTVALHYYNPFKYSLMDANHFPTLYSNSANKMINSYYSSPNIIIFNSYYVALISNQ